MSLEGALAVTRFGLGAHIDEISIASRAPKEWLLGQLTPNISPHPAFKDLLSSSEIYKLSRTYKEARIRRVMRIGLQHQKNIARSYAEILKPKLRPVQCMQPRRKYRFMNG